MLQQKILTTLFSLALASSMAAPAFAADAIPLRQASCEWETIALEQTSITKDDLPAAEDEKPLTRVELISVLYQKEGEPVVNFAMDYTDVDPDAADAEAIRWASSEGIVGGYSDGTFGPDDAVTREQMAVILYRYAQTNGQGFTGSWAFPLHYSDADEISEFAYEAVCWMTMKGIMGDTDGSAFSPKAEVTHEDAAHILERYMDVVEPVEIASPFVSCETMDEAAGIAGFSMGIPGDIPDWGNPSAIRAVETGMIEVLYQDNGGQLILRKGTGTEDISGDYGTYSEISTETIHDHTVTLKGNDGKIMTAVWCDDGYAYAIRATAGLDRDLLVSLISDTQ